jgi:hypothetical protein
VYGVPVILAPTVTPLIPHRGRWGRRFHQPGVGFCGVHWRTGRWPRLSWEVPTLFALECATAVHDKYGPRHIARLVTCQPNANIDDFLRSTHSS